jgi:hypothetical protein
MVAAAIRVANRRWISKSYLVRACGFAQAGARTFELENERHWKVEHSDFADEFGFRSFRILQEMGAYDVTRKKPALLRAFLHYQPRYPPPPKPKVTLGPP